MGCGGSKDSTSTPPRTTTRSGNAAPPGAKPEGSAPAASKELPAPWIMELEGPCDSKQLVTSMLDQVFEKCDVNGDGNISREELTAQLEKLLASGNTLTGKSVKTLVAESGLNPFLDIFDQLDANHDGKITRQEFKEQLAPAKASKVIQQLLKQVFDGIDKNGDGNISREELSGAYDKLLNTVEDKSGKNWTTLMVDAGLNPDFHVFEQLDANQDGKVSWEEFTTRLKAKPAVPLVLPEGGDSKQMVTAMLDQVFDRCDVNGDGNISREELTSQWEKVLQSNVAEMTKTYNPSNDKDVKTLVAECGLNPFMNVFDQLDANHDGKISKEEFKQQLKPGSAVKNIKKLLKQVFDGIDANGDGNLSREELSKAYEKLLNTNEEKTGKNWSTLMVDAGLNPEFYVFEQLDANNDGKVTWDEFRTQLESKKVTIRFEEGEEGPKKMVLGLLDTVFERCDVNGDGNISREELSSQWESVINGNVWLERGTLSSTKSVKELVAESGLNPFMNSFDQLDANNDGKISREEFKEQLQPGAAAKKVEQLLKEVFDRIDKNGDGRLTREELTAAYGGLLTTVEEKSGKNWSTLLTDAGLSPYFHVFEDLDADGDGKITWEEFSSRLKPGRGVEISSESKTTTCCM